MRPPLAIQQVFEAWGKKWLSLLVIATLIATQLVNVRPAYSEEPDEEYSLVAILVESEILDTFRRFDGLSADYAPLTAETIRSRVERYAEDVQSKLPYTKTAIISVGADEDPRNISSVLERLYFEGERNGKEVAKLVGVEIVGDLPIPVVNKNGNRFMSMYPYTDFKEKAYIYNPESGDFETNKEARDVQPEVWHGVITSPVEYKIDCEEVEGKKTRLDDGSCMNEEAYELIAQFFDKNHLFNKGLAGFDEFDNKMLIANEVVEENVINRLGFSNYQRYIDHMEDTAYHRYTKELAEELFTEINGELDELGADELGVDNDGDGAVDEDGRDDNNADGDDKTDEDGPGDMDGDNCPGECNKDDDRDCKDLDKDGIRSYIENQIEQDFENVFGDLIAEGKAINPTEGAYKNKMFPFPPISALLFSMGIIPPYDRTMCEDEDPREDDPNCYGDPDPNSEDLEHIMAIALGEQIFHPEWDDDEDGFCDEDGTADNDNDGDGKFDEDHGGEPDDSESGYFGDLPDVQSKMIIDRYLQKYYSQFEKHLGNTNNWTTNTGRYNARGMRSDGLVRNDTDTLIGLISKKDEFVKNYLRAQNEYLEGKVDGVVDEIQEDIPLIGKVIVSARLKYDHDNNSETPLFMTPPIPIDFTNHSIKQHSMILTPYIWGKPAHEIESAVECSLYLGTYEDCSTTGDGNCEDSKIVETNRVYDPLTSGIYNRDTDDEDETYPDNLKDGDDYGGCFGNNIENREWCFPDNSKGPIRSKKGTMKIEEDIPVDYRACYDFKLSSGFYGDPLIPVPLPHQPNTYLYWAENLADVTWKLGQDGIYNTTTPPHPPINFSGVGDSVDNEDEFEDALEYYKDNFLLFNGARPSPYTPYDEIFPPILDDPINDIYYTLGDLLEAMDYDISVNQIVSEDLFANGESPVVIDDPLERVDQAVFTMDRHYVARTPAPNGDPVLTPTLAQAHTIPSVVQHKEPTSDTIMQQVESGITRDLPVDSPRYTTFRGQDLAYKKIIYPNLFRYESVDDFREELLAKDEEIASLPGAENFDDVLAETIDEELNREMIEDAIAWVNMDIDEKHRYMLTTFLNPEERPFIKRPDKGYEVMYFVGNGDSRGYNFSFNGAVPEEETDEPFLEAEGAAARAAQAAIENSMTDRAESEEDEEGSGGAANMQIEGLPLFEWLEAMVEWVDDLSEQVSFGDTETYCGNLPDDETALEPDYDNDGIADSEDTSPFSPDKNKDGILDGAENTSLLDISVDRRLVKADGKEEILITITGKELTTSGYERNLSDSFTQVELFLTEKEKRIFEPVGYTESALIRGEAEFKVISTLVPDEIIVSATPINREDLKRTQGLSIRSAKERVNLVTYVHETKERTVTYDEEILENIIIKKDDSNIVARLDAEIGELQILDPSFEKQFIASNGDEVSHIIVNRKGSDESIAKISLNPDSFEFKNLGEGVEVMEAGENFEVLNAEGRKVVLVSANGHVFLNPGYTVSFKNDILSNLVIFSEENIALFEIELEVDFTEVIVNLKEIARNENRLKKFFGRFMPSVFASEFADADRDGLDNMQEFVIGTDIEISDTDGDKFSDSQEFFAGYHPLRVGALLFKDVAENHEAFRAIIELYLRGILSGFDDGTFRPSNKLTREQFVKINLGAACIDCSAFSESVKESIDADYSRAPFPDTNITPELQYCVAKGKIDGIVSGYLGEPYEGFFVPLNNISRAEATKVLIETAASLVDSSKFDANTYSGNDRPWFYNYIIESQEHGLYPKNRFTEVDHLSTERFTNWFNIQIVNNGDFMTWLAEPITRAEFAMMVQNLFQVSDCQAADRDGDGLSDNAETFQYGTDPFDPDTDKGGITDGEEIVRNMNPLDKRDEGKYREFETVDAPEEELTLSDDTDSDGLSNEEELALGTDPEDADSDGDGISDSDEVLFGTDPNSSRDGDQVEDILGESADDGDDDGGNGGIEIEGYFIEKEVVFREKKADETFVSDIIIPKDVIPVSELSENLIVEAQILDSAGRINFDDNSSVVQFIVEDDSFGELERQTIQVVDGSAITTLLSKPTSGNYSVRAIVINKRIAPDDKSVLIHSLDPVDIEIEARTNVLQAGVISRVDADINLKDKFDNFANYDVYRVQVEADGPVRIGNADEDENLEGLQLIFSEGKRTLELFSLEKPGEITVKAHILGPDGEKLKTALLDLESHKEINLELSHTNPDMRADASSDTEVRITVVNEDGIRLDGFNEAVHVSLSDESLGVIRSNSEVQMEGGFGTAVLRSSTIAGKLIIHAESVGVNPGVTTIAIEPLSPAFIQLTADSDTLFTEEGETLTLSANLFDKYGNPVLNSEGTGGLLQFSITPETSDFAELETVNPIPTKKGKVEIKLLPKKLSGPIHVMVEDFNDQLTPAAIRLYAKKRVDFEDIKSANPNVLFASLLGTGSADITEENSFAAWTAVSGRTQSVVSLLKDPESFVKRLQVKGNALISNIDTTYLYTDVIPANDPLQPTRFAVKDILTDKILLDVFMRVSPTRRMYLNIEDPGLTQEGIFLNLLTEAERFGAAKHKENLNLTEHGRTVLSVTPDGKINVIDKSFDLKLDSLAAYPRLTIWKSGNVIAEILMNFSFDKDVRILDEKFDFKTSGSLNTGIYIVPHLGLTTFQLEKTFNGNSSKNPVSYSLTDTSQPLPSEQSPGSTYLSLEHAHTTQGIGFEDDNKHILLFSSGMMAGEAMKDNMSEIGILLGDATISLEPRDIPDSGFDRTIGTKILNGTELIKEIRPYDYNDDGLSDLLVSYEDGDVKLLRNKHALNRFEDAGTLISVKNGILSEDTADFDDNGFEDIVIAAREPCRADEVICVDMYWNDEGEFKRENLKLELDQQIHMLRAGDVNNDKDPDIVVSDASGSIYVFYNEKGKINTEGSFVGNLGVKIDPDMNLKDELLISHPQMRRDNLSTSNDDNLFRKLSVLDDRGFAGGASTSHFDEINSLQNSGKNLKIAEPKVKTEKEFIRLQYDDAFFSSSKVATDINEDILMPGDSVEYKITLRNTSGFTISDVILSDTVPDSMTLDKESISCESCTGFDLEFTNSLKRPFTIRNFSVPAGEAVEIRYEATINNVPKVNITLQENFTDHFDSYLDIAASPEGNTSGIMTYFYSDFLQEGGKVKYTKSSFIPTIEDKASGEFEPEDGVDREAPLNASSEEHDPDEHSEELLDTHKDFFTGDLDGDGLPNQWDSVSGDLSLLNFTLDMDDNAIGQVLDMASAVVEDAISKLTCSGGCLALPLNISFFTPGQFNMFGMPVGFDNGLPLFCWGAVNTPPGVGTASLCSGSTGGRLYLSPTLNGGLVFSVCIGVDKAGQCWSFNIPLLQALGVCDKINGSIESAMSVATSMISSVNGVMALAMNGQSSGGSDESSGGVVSYNLGSYSVPSSSNSNIRVPGFPSVFTDWIDRQTEEFGDLLDLPDIYFIYPDPQSMVGSFNPSKNQELKMTSLYDALNFMNSLPLFNIESEEIIFRLPAVTQIEIQKLQQDAERFTENLRSQLEYYKTAGEGLEAGATGQALASVEGQQFIEGLDEFIRSIEQNMLVMEEYSKLPEKIMEYRFAVSTYVTQIICYVDTILNYSGGYVIKNKNRVKAWTKAIIDVIDSVKTWQGLLNLSVSYQESCDKCTTSRQSLMELMMKVFVTIPSPPIIDLPKWPDIVLDISRIQGGITLYFPELKIVPEPIVLPELPKIFIPQNMPAGELMTFMRSFSFPEVAVIPGPPRLPDLPKLPGLPLPKLPDLPPPPKFPELPSALSGTVKGLEKIIKIVCLVKNGFIPTNEAQLKTKVEELTARGSDLLLPIDKGFAIETPDIKIDFVDRIEINTRINLDVDVTPLKDAISGISEKAGQLTDALSGAIEVGTDAVNNLSETASDVTSDVSDAAEGAVDSVSGAGSDLSDEASGAVDGAADTAEEAVDGATEGSPELEARLDQMKNIIDELSPQVARFNKETAGFSDDLKIVADIEWLDTDSPVLNRDLDDLRLNAYDLRGLDSGYLKDLDSLKTELITYVDTMHENTNRFGDNLEIENVTRMFAADGAAAFLKPDKSTVSFENDYTEDTSFISAKEQLQQIFADTRDLKDTWIYGRPLAANSVMERGAELSGGGAEILHKGIYIHTPEGDSEKVVNYVKESGSGSLLVFEDVDRDNDDDLIYTLGSDIYLKENYKKEREGKFYRKPAKTYELSELLPEDTAVNMFKLVDLGNGTVNVKWLENHSASGYELEIKHALNDFFRKGETATERILAIPKSYPTSEFTPKINEATLDVLNGEIEVESSTEEFSNLIPGDLIRTGSGEAIIRFDGETEEGSRIKLEEDTVFEIPDITASSPEIYVEGEATILTGDNVLARGGNIFSTGNNSKITVNFDTREELVVEANSNFEIPLLSKGDSVITDLDGSVQIESHPRRIVSRGDVISPKGGILLHATTNSKMKFQSNFSGMTIIAIDRNTKFVVPSSIPSDTEIEVVRGQIELIDLNSEPEVGDAYVGMLLTPNSVLRTYDNSSAKVDHLGAEINLSEVESLRILPLNDTGNPQLNFELENGNYYTKIRALSSDGARSTVSPQTLFAPQECGDERPAFASSGSSRKKVSIFKPLEIDGSSSNDLDGEIEEYFYDLDLSEDKDRDGDATNDDEDPSDENIDPKVTVGPYQDLETRYLKLWVKDQGGNLSAQEIAVDIYVPDIILSPVSAEKGIIQGHTSPRESEMPFRIIRNRDGMFDTLKDSDGNDIFYTDENGSYYIDDFKLDEEIVVKNAAGDQIANIDEDTGRTVITDDNYRLRALPANNSLPTRVNLENIDSGEVLLTTLLIPEVNTDVSIDDDINYSGEILRNLTGVHIKPYPNPTTSFMPISATDRLYPGGVNIFNGNDRIGIVASNGNVHLFDESLTLRVKGSTVSNDPYVLELHKEGNVLADIYISIFDGDGLQFDYIVGDPERAFDVTFTGSSTEGDNPDSDNDGFSDDFELMHQLNPLEPDRDGDKDGDGLTNSQEFNLGTNPNNADTDSDGLPDMQEVLQATDPVRVNSSPFNDIPISDRMYDTVYDFYTKGIIQGYMIEGRQVFRPEKHITRAEFTKIMLEILCIEPRPEAYEEPPVFNDIAWSEDLPWYYPITKESFFRNFITGYLAEVDARGRAPYKPNRTINFAETAKIIEEVLSRFVTEEGTTVLQSLEEIEVGTPWYLPYLKIARDLTPYINLKDQVREAFILSAEEAKTPGTALTRYKFLEISERVLNVYSCYEIDSDRDGLPNYLEARFGTDPNSADTDGDGINDLDEILNGLDPNDEGDGGTGDGAAGGDTDPDGDGLSNDVEEDLGTDPLDPDSDHGGVRDGEEVDRGTDPNYTADDFPTDTSDLPDLTADIGDGFTDADSFANNEEPGAHITIPACTVCPCPVSIENSADVKEDDIIFTAITSVDNSEIFTASDPVTFVGKLD
ncbi:DUF11 domain-containing protein [Candidatus Peregrinibacteria bacterium]|nr:DUF11 domain-containing protein [Candidatus Peregrinibacteria bacterium]